MNDTKEPVSGSAASSCWADREEAIRRIVVERDILFSLLTRICRETVCLQAPSNGTNNEPTKQRIYCFAADPDIHGEIQSLCLHDALRMMPIPTPLPDIPSNPHGEHMNTENVAASAPMHRVVGQTLPCNSACPKCGGTDISRRHHEKGEDARTGLSIDSGRSSEFVDRYSIGWKVLRECIVHHCRDCQYYWDTACLPNPRVQPAVTEPAKQAGRGPLGCDELLDGAK